MKMKYILVIVILLFIRIDIFSQWVQQTNGLPENWNIGWSIDACDSNCAAISVDIVSEPSAVYLTKNGGNLWENILTFSHSNETAMDISIIDKNHIWVATESSDTARILATSDGGKNWVTQFLDTNKTDFFNYIGMFDLNNGISMGDGIHGVGNAIFLKTVDGGISWQEKENNIGIFASSDLWRKIDFVDTETGFFTQSWLSYPPVGIFKTLDGGDNWTTINQETAFYLLKFYNKSIGLATKYKRDSTGTILSQLLHRTTDGGNTWTIFENKESFSYPEDFEFIPNKPKQVWYLYSQDLLFSNDTGRTWTEQILPIENFGGRDIVFTDDKHGWILCDNGKLFYTNNNGGMITNVEKQKINNLPVEFILEQNYPNPFNPITTINYSLPPFVKGRVGVGLQFTLKVYDILGKEIATLVDEEKQSGSYSIDFNAKNLSSGIYYYQLKIENFADTKKMLLLR